MRELLVGKIVGTHGIKGELKVLSDFKFSDKVFAKDKRIIINNKTYIINSVRKHKNFILITLNDYNDINQVLDFIKKNIYIDEEDLVLNDEEILDEDLVKYHILTTDGKSGIIKEIFWASPTNKIMRVELDKEVLIPFNSPMIKSISKSKKEVIIELISGM